MEIAALFQKEKRQVKLFVSSELTHILREYDQSCEQTKVTMASKL